jgi:ATP-dependent DNA ligase
LDGELVIPVGEVLSFDALQMRLHPAQSRIRKLAGETPAILVLFDILANGKKNLTSEPLSARRTTLEALVGSRRNHALCGGVTSEGVRVSD